MTVIDPKDRSMVALRTRIEALEALVKQLVIEANRLGDEEISLPIGFGDETT